jgi:hypothetical protein
LAAAAHQSLHVPAFTAKSTLRALHVCRQTCYIPHLRLLQHTYFECCVVQALLVVPPSVLQTALASASQQLPAPPPTHTQGAVDRQCHHVPACNASSALQALLVVPPSVLQTALASASQQLGRPTQELLQLLLAEPGAVLGLGYLGGSQGAAESWAQRLGLDQQVRGGCFHRGLVAKVLGTFSFYVYWATWVAARALRKAGRSGWGLTSR